MKKQKPAYVASLSTTSYDSCTSYPEVMVEVRVAFPQRKIIQRIDHEKLRQKLLDVISESVDLE